MERKTLARWLVVSALACFSLLVGAQIASAQQTVQGTQSSDGSSASTGETSGTNSSNVNAGPSANGSDGANSQQIGQNSVTINQSGSAESGDPVAGAQVTGVVADDATVQNQNSATDPQAEGGDATVTNDATVTVGPQATADGDPATAQASQNGSNTLDLSQSGDAVTGDAVAGSQVTGIVGAGEHTVQNQNNASGDSTVTSGTATVDNDAEVSVGPFGLAEFGGTAQTGQIGDNDATLSQSGIADSGDALFGAQVTGVVGGSATVQNQNSSFQDGGDVQSGNANVTNDVVFANDFAIVGPVALTGDGGNPQASQTGNNILDVAQVADASTGDALSGSQVTGGVGDQDGFFTVQNQQASEDDVAFSGTATAQNTVEGDVGVQAGGFSGRVPDSAMASQNGDNDVTYGQVADAQVGDALAGSQVTGAVNYDDVTVQNQNSASGPLSESGDAIASNTNVSTFVGPFADAATSAQASQTGDNSFVADQAISANSGDALAGGQVTGVVADDGVVEVQNQNTVADADALSGDVFADNEANPQVGPFVGFNGAAGFGPTVETAQAEQIGDNAVDVVQSVDADSGDAIAAGQVTGVVADEADVTVQNQNTCSIGELTACGVANAGNVNASNDLTVNNFAEGTTGPFAFGVDAQASQNGDNAVIADQAIEASSGDAIAGSQVTGAVGGDEVTIQNQNSADTAFAGSGNFGNVTATNTLDLGNTGPFAEGTDTAMSEQIGDNLVDFAQGIDITSGDAVAGAQVTGVVGANDSTVQVQNDDTGSVSESGDTSGANTASGNLGPAADGADANAQQTGDSGFAGSQTLTQGSGDAVSGSQVNGEVGAAGGAATTEEVALGTV